MDQAPDLLIFRKRAEDAEKAKDEVQQTAKPEPAPVQKQEVKLQPKPESKPNVRADILIPPKQIQAEAQKPNVEYRANLNKDKSSGEDHVKTMLSISESIAQAKGQFCINHPWRHAYAVCNICRLAYCYVDIMEQAGRLYCLNDIDSATKSELAIKQNPEINTFSIIASVIFIGNSLILGYFTYSQAGFIVRSALNTDIIKFLTNLPPSYYIPIANSVIAILGIFSAIAILRKSLYGIGLCLAVSIGGLSVILYEYLNSSVPYLFVSTVLLVLSLGSIVYSRMSSLREVSEEQVIAPDIDWPKPETF